MKYILFLSVMFASFTLFGSEHGEGGMSPERTLFWNFFNFGIFFAIIFNIFRKKLTVFFNQQHEDIEAIYTDAQNKQKAAAAEKDRMQSEINNLTMFEDKVRNDTISNTLKFKEQYQVEIDNKIQRAKKESDNKVEATYKNGVDTIRKELMSEVVTEVEDLVAQDATMKKKVTEKIMGMIG